jgi:two-component system alkaline phosphatase synthesis response regulator PhoP
MKQTETPRSSAHVLIVEDEPEMQFLLTENLEYEGLAVTVAATGEDALQALGQRSYALVILDVMLPGMSGFAVCREIRARGLQVPIIMLTARSAESDRIVGLDLGADDYVSKPFGVKELLARVRAQLRRGTVQPHAADAFMLGDVRVDLRKELVTRRGHPVEMSTREFELLRYFLSHRGEVVSREQLLRDVWGYNQVVVTRTVDTFVAKLRVHIEATPHEPRYLVTVHGSGYRLVV